ncbi:probable WRKY transcription factor 3 [Rhododendron vialii]|uniref:probable WRKY transcription factor 3 n=1 Tax=Rhododendron vialii TaxID=182163 RepID=UPI00265DA76A|nr:probable WRKY transcription factor 3 [Rhododendron vialii]
MAKTDGAQRPTITLPPRSSIETLFTGLSPGPLTLVSNFFSDYDNCPESDCRSFSQLLAGAMASPVAAAGTPKLPNFFPDNSAKEGGNSGEEKLGFKQNRPVNLVVGNSSSTHPPHVFMIPPGLSPSGFLNSPGFFSPLQSPFGMTHQQALAQVTALATLSQSLMQAEHQPSSLATSEAESWSQYQSFPSNTTIQQQVHSVISEPENSFMESSEASQSERKCQPPPATVDKPGNDGYNWRKYGQKQVKASEYPRSYYKCTELNCPVKKKVERNFDGKISEITYKGQHNHELPQSNKRAKDGTRMKQNTKNQSVPELGLVGETETSTSNETFHSVSERDQSHQTSTQLTLVQLPESTENIKMSNAEIVPNEGNDDEPNPKRRNTEVGTSELTSSHKTVTEARIVVQTRSEVDLLDDGFKWRKYGQKVVKGNAHPRSYYKCTYAGCNVRKHVERASSDPKAVVTTYEGKHNHDVPTARKSSNNTANSNTLQLKTHTVVAKKPALREEMEFGSNDRRAVFVPLKEEQIMA